MYKLNIKLIIWFYTFLSFLIRIIKINFAKRNIFWGVFQNRTFIKEAVQPTCVFERMLQKLHSYISVQWTSEKQVREREGGWGVERGERSRGRARGGERERGRYILDVLRPVNREGSYPRERPCNFKISLSGCSIYSFWEMFLERHHCFYLCSKSAETASVKILEPF